MKTLPPQLKRPEFSFAKLDGKNPNVGGVGWQNQRHSWEEAEKWLNSGFNYGVMGGIGGVIIIDGDSWAVINVVFQNLPPTFTVMTGSGKIHFYFFCPEITKKVIFNDALEPSLFQDGEDHYGEIITTGFQAVGPGSIHPNTKEEYTVLIDEEIVVVSKEQVLSALSLFLKHEKAEVLPKESKASGIDALKITDVLPEVTRTGNIIHPVHGADGAGNLNLDLEKNLWHCFRCDSGGGPVSLFAVMEGLIDCSDAQGSFLRGDAFLRVKEAAEKKFPFLVPPPVPPKEKKKFSSRTLTDIVLSASGEILNTKPEDIVSFGYDFLDNQLTGIFRGELIVVGGESGTGKTTFATNIIYEASKTRKCYIFALEDRLNYYGAKLIFFKLNSLRMKLGKPCYSWNNFIRNEISGEEYLSLHRQAVEEAKNDNIEFFEADEMMNTSLLEQVILQKINEGVALFLCDHLHEFDMSRGNKSKADYVEEVMVHMKSVLNRTGARMILVVHYKKLEGKKPSIDSFKDSISIVQNANYVINLWRDRSLKPGSEKLDPLFEVNQTEIFIPKARNPNGEATITVNFNRLTNNYTLAGKAAGTPQELAYGKKEVNLEVDD